MASFVDVCRFTAVSNGTGDFVVSAAVTGYQTPANANAVNTSIYRYRAENAALTEWEVGYGAYTSGSVTLARTAVLFNSSGTTSKISFTAAPQVALVALAEDLNAPPLPTKFWSGYTHSNNGGTPNTKIDVTSGSCRDSTDAINIVNSSGTIDCGTNGAVNTLDAGSLGASTLYYTFAITTVAGATGFLASASATAPTLPATYTKFRRIGAFKTDGSSHILPFTQVNDHWWYTTSIRDVSTAAQSTTFIAYVLSVPRVQGVTALYSITYFAASAITVSVLPGFLASTAALGQSYFSPSSSGSTEITESQVDSSAQIQIKSTSASTTITVDTAGWIDTLQ